MSIHHTETEQVEMIKAWFKKYGYWLSFAFLAIILGMVGYRLWDHHVIKINSQASERYQQLMLGIANDDDSMVNAQANDLMAHYPKTIYAQAASLAQAKLSVSQKNYTLALSQLHYAMTEGKNPALQQIARLRSARILIIQKKYTPALNLLTTVNDIAYLPAINETKGDIYLASGNNKKARMYYQKALKGFSKVGLHSPFLTMKLNNITEE